MYNLAEYIAVRRAASIVKQFILNGITYKGCSFGTSEDYKISRLDIKYSSADKEIYNNTKLIENLIDYVSNGVTKKRFLFVEPSNNLIYAMLLLEIHEPSHIYIPLLITKQSILMVSPFGVKPEHNVTEYIMELIPTSTLEDCDNENILAFLDTKISFKENDQETVITILEALRLHIKYFMEANSETDKILTENFLNTDITFARESTNDDSTFTKLLDKFGTEALGRFIKSDYSDVDGSKEEETYLSRYNHFIIDDHDYIPMTIKADVNNNINHDKDDAMHNVIPWITNVSQIKKGNTLYRNFGVSMKSNDNPIMYLPVRDKGSVLFYLDDCYYLGDEKLVVEVKVENKQTLQITTYDQIVDLFEHFDTSTEDIGTEGFVSDLWKAAKVFGIKSGSVLYSVFATLAKVPVKSTKYVWNALKNVHLFTSKLEHEKDEALRMAEKIINDELDHGEEQLHAGIQAGLRGFALTAVVGNILLLPFFIFNQKEKLYRNRLKSIERVEFKLDGILERIEHKLESAKSDGNPEVVDEILKEKHMYEFAKLKLIEYKREVIKKDRIRYQTFDKDMTLTSRQRIDAMVSSGGYYNIHGEYGKDFLKD